MGETTHDLMKLRPVTFTYKQDQSGLLQYGLIAEEVAEVYPELVVHSADGQIETVRYQLLSSMLLNEWQQQHQTIAKLGEALQEKDAQISGLESRLVALEQAAGVSGASTAGFSPFGNLTTGLIFGGMLLAFPGLVLGYRRYMG